MKYFETGFGDEEQKILYGKVEGINVGRWKNGRLLKPKKVKFWSFFHQREDGSISRVGKEYSSEKLLLADCHRYCTEDELEWTC